MVAATDQTVTNADLEVLAQKIFAKITPRFDWLEELGCTPVETLLDEVRSALGERHAGQPAAEE